MLFNGEKKKFLPGEMAVGAVWRPRGGSDPEDPRGAGARRSADAEVRLTWTALRLLFILNPYRVGVNSSDFIPTPDNVIVLLVTNRQRAAGDKARL